MNRVAVVFPLPEYPNIKTISAIGTHSSYNKLYLEKDSPSAQYASYMSWEMDNRCIILIIRTFRVSSNMQTGSYAILLITYYLCRFRWRPQSIRPYLRIPANDDISPLSLSHFEAQFVVLH